MNGGVAQAARVLRAVEADAAAAAREGRSLLTEPGAYTGISNADYHRAANLLPAPSLSSSGAKMILERSLYHFWANSPMNADRPAEEAEESEAKRIGKAAHDMLLLPESWTTGYYVMPEGFNSAHTSRFAMAIAERAAAQRRGMTILSFREWQTARRVVRSIEGDAGAFAALQAGQPEVTLVWQDQDTGVWLRARPDWLPNSIIAGRSDVARVVTDLKFMAGDNCHPDGWSRAVGRYGYHISAGFYDMGIEAIFGRGADAHIFLPVEKDYPHYVSLYQLPSADLARGKAQARIAINRFAEALQRGTEAAAWPGYTADVEQVGLSPQYRKLIDEHGSRGDAALINAIEGE